MTRSLVAILALVSMLTPSLAVAGSSQIMLQRILSHAGKVVKCPRLLENPEANFESNKYTENHHKHSGDDIFQDCCSLDVVVTQYSNMTRKSEPGQIHYPDFLNLQYAHIMANGLQARAPPAAANQSQYSSHLYASTARLRL